MASIRKTRGQPRAFTDPQNAALHEGLRELLRRKDLSQAALGELLGVSQQGARRLMKFEEAGFSHPTATTLVRILGFSSVDTFFRSRRVTTPSEPPHAKSA